MGHGPRPFHPVLDEHAVLLMHPTMVMSASPMVESTLQRQRTRVIKDTSHIPALPLASAPQQGHMVEPHQDVLASHAVPCLRHSMAVFASLPALPCTQRQHRLLVTLAICCKVPALHGANPPWRGPMPPPSPHALV